MSIPVGNCNALEGTPATHVRRVLLSLTRLFVFLAAQMLLVGMLSTAVQRAHLCNDDVCVLCMYVCVMMCVCV